MGSAILQVVQEIQAEKERRNIMPSFATMRELKRRFGNISDDRLNAMLEAEFMKGTITRHRTINSYAYSILKK